LLLENRLTGKQLIIDTKYKLRDRESTNAKQGISQSDLYQMISYALRRETDQVILLYPCRYGQLLLEETYYSVSSGMLTTRPVHIRGLDIPVTGLAREEIEARVVQFLTGAVRPS